MNRLESTPRSIRVARKIGETVATVGFVAEPIIRRLTAFNPLATNTFTLSDRIGARSRAALSEAIRKSNLPEGIYVTDPTEATQGNPTKPFVVVTVQKTEAEGLASYRRGATKYVAMDFDSDALAKKLSTTQ